jgi:hypothetical protein
VVTAAAALLLVSALTGSAHALRLRYPLAIPARGERHVCEALRVPGAPAGYAVTSWKVRIRGVSHHLQLFDVSGYAVHPGQREGGYASCLVDGGTLPPVAVEALAPRAQLRLPRGVLLPWRDPQPILVDFHAVNPTARPTHAVATITLRFRRVRPGDRVAMRWAVWAENFAIPPFTQAVVEHTTPMPRMRLLTIGGHMHVRATELTAALDGAPLYTQRDWAHPRTRVFTQPLDVGGRALHLACAYDNGVTQPVRRCDGVPCPLVAGSRADDAMCVVSGFAVSP